MSRGCLVAASVVTGAVGKVERERSGKRYLNRCAVKAARICLTPAWGNVSAVTVPQRHEASGTVSIRPTPPVPLTQSLECRRLPGFLINVAASFDRRGGKKRHSARNIYNRKLKTKKVPKNQQADRFDKGSLGRVEARGGRYEGITKGTARRLRGWKG